MRPLAFLMLVATAACGADDLQTSSRDAALVPAPDASAPAPRPNATSSCPVPDLITSYPGYLPPNPYEALAPDTCLLGAHDVILILGCPSNDDGSPSTCQLQRVDLAIALRDAGIARDVIVSGAAVHNAFIEARALLALLLARGVPAGEIFLEEKALHTDENIYYSSLIMQARGFQNAVVVSEDAGQLVYTAICDADCCVDLGRLTLSGFPLTLGGQAVVKTLGHYVLYPFTGAVSADECRHIEIPTKAMCTNLASRHACAGRLSL